MVAHYVVRERRQVLSSTSTCCPLGRLEERYLQAL